MTRTPTDLHPDDRDLRVGLRDMLVQRRYDLGLSQRELCALQGRTQSATASFERATSWRLITVQQRCRFLGWRLILRLEGLPVDVDEALTTLRPSDPHRADLWDQSALMAALVDARHARGVSQAQLSRLLDTSERAIWHTEQCETGLMFITPQRHARALGGSLWIGVEDLVPRAEAESRAQYLEHINNCSHDVPPDRGPGWICGGCGRDRQDISEIEEEELAA